MTILRRALHGCVFAGGFALGALAFLAYEAHRARKGYQHE